MKNDINEIKGQCIQIIEFVLGVEEDEAYININAIVNQKSVHMSFHNVSNLEIHDISKPFQIVGFDIVDNKERGWDNSSRFYIYDFEDNKISFYCEWYELIL